MAIIGECFCEGVKYRIDGKLHDARSCHCSGCRKASWEVKPGSKHPNQAKLISSGRC